MLLMMLVGEMCVGIRVIFSSLPVGQDLWVCHVKIWFGHLGFSLVFGGLFLKMWRVDKIINTTSVRRVKITNNDIARLGICVCFCIISYLFIISFASGLYTQVDTFTVANQDTLMYTCEEEISGIQIAMYVLECFFVIWGIRLCNATKNAPSAINDSGSTALATAIICATCLMVMPIIYLVGLTSVVQEVIAGFAFVLCLFATQIIIFAPKVLSLYLGEEVDKKLKVSAVAAKVYQETAEDTSFIRACRTALNEKATLDDKHQFCVQQLEYWRNMLVIVVEKRSSATGTWSNGETNTSAVTQFGKLNSSLESGEVMRVTNISQYNEG